MSRRGIIFGLAFSRGVLIKCISRRASSTTKFTHLIHVVFWNLVMMLLKFSLSHPLPFEAKLQLVKNIQFE
ncbi:hypothetical protein ACS0TY_034304 [Phlomoides rotata]